MNNIKQKVDILIISSVLNSNTLNEWLGLMTQCYADTTDKNVIIVSPYDEEKLSHAINVFKKANKFAGFKRIKCNNVNHQYLHQQIINVCSEIDKEFVVRNISSIFSPCQGDKNNTTNKCHELLRNHEKNLFNLDYGKIIENDNYMLAHSSAITSTIISYFPNANLHHFVLDPQEVDMQTFINDKRVAKQYFVHKLNNHLSTIVNPFILYDFADKLNEIREIALFESSSTNLMSYFGDKQFDFVFGLTAFNEERIDVVKQMLHVNENPKNRFYAYYKDGENVVDTRIDYSQYLNQLKQSKSTLTIPAYDPTTFSTHRFVEALAQGCLSIIYKANYEVAFSTQMNDLIRKHLYINDLSQLAEKIEYVNKNWNSIIVELLKTADMEILSHKGNYTNHLSTYINA